MRRALIVAGLVLSLGVTNAAILGKERLLSSGTAMLLELAPVDPRSLIQGDYMRLDYALARGSGETFAWPRTGHIVVRVDADSVARFVRRHTSGVPLAAGEHLLRYRRRGRGLRIGSDAFYFQEGYASRYETARYGEVRVGDDGESVLVGLRDDRREPLR